MVLFDHNAVLLNNLELNSIIWSKENTNLYDSIADRSGHETMEIDTQGIPNTLLCSIPWDETGPSSLEMNIKL